MGASPGRASGSQAPCWDLAPNDRRLCLLLIPTHWGAPPGQGMGSLATALGAAACAITPPPWREQTQLALPPPRTPGARQPPLPGMVGSAHPPQPPGERGPPLPHLGYYCWALRCLRTGSQGTDAESEFLTLHIKFKAAHLFIITVTVVSLRELEELCAGLRGLRGGVAARKWGPGRGGKETLVVRGLGAGSWELGEPSQHAPAFCSRWHHPGVCWKCRINLYPRAPESAPGF